MIKSAFSYYKKKGDYTVQRALLKLVESRQRQFSKRESLEISYIEKDALDGHNQRLIFPFKAFTY